MLHRPEHHPIETSSSYARIARSIRHLAENYDSQPSLEEAARAAGLSAYHFQREFSRLAGVSPKSFISHLTLQQAKARLQSGATVLDAALDAGLSGPSRLHDLCLKVEAMTPGDYAKGGAGLLIRYGFHATLLGTALLMITERGLCGLAFSDEGDEETAFADMRSRWPRAEFVHDQAAVASYAAQIFPDRTGGNRIPRAALPIQLFGTPWQIKVWQALLAIPEGRVASYRTIAERVCTERASRATGAAVGRNPISLIIPCHRVLASSGALTGYHWGEARKRALLALEAARASDL